MDSKLAGMTIKSCSFGLLKHFRLWYFTAECLVSTMSAASGNTVADVHEVSNTKSLLVNLDAVSGEIAGVDQAV